MIHPCLELNIGLAALAQPGIGGMGDAIPQGGMGDGIPRGGMGDVSPKIYIHTIYIYWNIESHE